MRSAGSCMRACTRHQVLTAADEQTRDCDGSHAQLLAGSEYGINQHGKEGAIETVDSGDAW